MSQRVRFTGVFEPLCEPAYFVQVRVDPELRTIGWPNGADLDPDVLYSQITGEPILVADPPNIMLRVSTAAR